MIQPNELRVGNFIYDKDGNVIQVLALSYEVIKVLDRNSVLYIDASPIPLSEDMLILSGFYRDRTGYSLPDLNSLSFSVTKNGEFLACWLDRSIGVNIKYLHQLQNLYYALTQTELTITL